MNRKVFLSFFLASAVLLSSTVNVSVATSAGIYPYLTWRNNPTVSIVVNWWNPAAAGDSSVDYGLSSIYGSTANNPTITNYHHVEIAGLSPATTYHYRVRSSDGTVGSDNTFTTAGLNATSFCFAVYGDPRGTATADEPYYTRHRALCNWILAQPDIDFALETGDTVWEGATSLAIAKYWPDFFEIESNLSKSKVIMATLGGHEVQGGNTYYWNDFYTSAFPDTNSSVPGNNGRVYSFDYGNAHFVCLSSYQVNLVQQKNWLIADLTAAKTRPNIKWIFAFMHAPMYTTSGHSNRTDEIAAWGPVFDEYGVDIVFASHNHLYERSYPIKAGAVVPEGQGTLYITNGMGGAEFNNGAPNEYFVYVYGDTQTKLVDPANADKKTAVTCITIDGVHLTSQTILNYNNEVIDTFELFKIYPGDFNKDEIVDSKDLGEFAGVWLDTGYWP
jgi:hypothetical protein